ncbi:ATP-binding protein [Vulgatibacter sp.]|uniref:ATP-binding protein n=1 Tax=Vulgatibacter sp. TaxID=1971226 RepID=UPI00356878C6
MRGDTAPFERHLRERNLSAARLAAVLVAVLMPAGALLDWFTNPALLGSFFLLRIGATLLALCVLALTFASWAPRHTYVLGIGPGLIGAGSIQVMIEQLDGFASPYYAGLNLCILGMGIVFAWTLLQTAVACGLIVLIWAVPALLGARALEFGPFFNNLYFLVLTTLIAVASNETRYRQVRREFEARAEVARTSEQLAGALARLRELDRLKSEFFANVSHELRTPLTLILSPVEERLGRSEGSSDQGLFEVIRRNAVRLLRLIDDLLDLSRIDAGRLRLQIGAVDMRLLAEQAIEAFRPAAAARGVTLELVVGSDLEGVYGDPHRLEIVLTNLLGNALKFTPERGTIGLEVQIADGRAVVMVRDTGLGIAPEDLPRIFDRFHQVEGGARRTREGAGIGLALARELVELHGGSLAAESELGHGSTFTMRLPLGREHFRSEVIERRKVAMDVGMGRRASDHAIATAEPLVPEPALPQVEEVPVVLEGGRRARIVIAEDNADLREFLRALLGGSYDVFTAVDGREALELVRSERPDLVLSDVMMPQMTGMDLCAALKADPALQNTPIILLTARTGSEAVLEGYTSGADDFVNKPVHPRILLARIKAQLRLRSLSLQLAQQERLAAVGTLAAGVGHEVRNPINAVLNGARALLDRQGTDPATRRVLEVIAEAGGRIEGISAALLDHAHPAENDRPRPCDVRAGLDATLRLLEHRTREIRVHRTYGTSRLVVASAAELNQVFLNLLDNALRSSAQNVWVRVEEREDKVVVGVDDDGPGVPNEIASRIFDPFFTTRGPGEGTGLGLYLSRKIVGRYGGDLRLTSRQGGGASFSVELPGETRT